MFRRDGAERGALQARQMEGVHQVRRGIRRRAVPQGESTGVFSLCFTTNVGYDFVDPGERAGYVGEAGGVRAEVRGGL